MEEGRRHGARGRPPPPWRRPAGLHCAASLTVWFCGEPHHSNHEQDGECLQVAAHSSSDEAWLGPGSGCPLPQAT